MTLTRKLTLAFLLIAVTAAAIVALSIRLTNTTRLNQLVLEQQRADFAALITDYYRQTGSLNRIQTNPTNSTPNPFPPTGATSSVLPMHRASLSFHSGRNSSPASASLPKFSSATRLLQWIASFSVRSSLRPRPLT
ncbi:MAG: hypothetical protein AB1750_02390 [Chloroflexota bacterium]